MEIIILIEMDEDLKEQVIADMGKWSQTSGSHDKVEGWQWGLITQQNKTHRNERLGQPHQSLQTYSLIIQQKIILSGLIKNKII